MVFRTTAIGFLCGASLFMAGAASSQPSPALCHPSDAPETGIQGDVPQADQQSGRADEGYNCGLALLSEFDVNGSGVQGAGHCAYVRIGGGTSTGASPDPNAQIRVLDLSDPSTPVEVRTLMPLSGSETMRTHVSAERSILVNGRAVYDISDCENPVLKGEIEWPGFTPWPAGGYHDVRIGHDGNRVYSGVYALEVDISNLEDPTSWTITNHTCAIAVQEGATEIPIDQCETDAYEITTDAEQYSHGPDDNGDGTRIYLGSQGANDGNSVLRIIDRTQDPAQIVSATGPNSPGHNIDWFRLPDGREFLLHSNEFALNDSCTPHPRPADLGWSFEAYLTDISNEQAPTLASLVEIAINKPENCAQLADSGHGPFVSYHSINSATDPRFATISFGASGIRMFDIRDPYAPTEVAYYNKGSVAHDGVSYYDAARGLLLIPSDGLKVLEIEPQVFDALGMPHPSDPAYPRNLPEPDLALSLAAGLALLATLRRRASD